MEGLLEGNGVCSLREEERSLVASATAFVQLTIFCQCEASSIVACSSKLLVVFKSCTLELTMAIAPPNISVCSSAPLGVSCAGLPENCGKFAKSTTQFTASSTGFPNSRHRFLFSDECEVAKDFKLARNAAVVPCMHCAQLENCC